MNINDTLNKLEQELYSNQAMAPNEMLLIESVKGGLWRVDRTNRLYHGKGAKLFFAELVGKYDAFRLNGKLEEEIDFNRVERIKSAFKALEHIFHANTNHSPSPKKFLDLSVLSSSDSSPRSNNSSPRRSPRSEQSSPRYEELNTSKGMLRLSLKNSSKDTSPRTPLQSPPDSHRGERKGSRTSSPRSTVEPPKLVRILSAKFITTPVNTVHRNLWLKVAYLSGDIKVMNDPCLYDYDYFQRESFVPLLEKGAIELRVDPLSNRRLYYHANWISLDSKDVTIGKIYVASAPFFYNCEFYKKDLRGHFWESMFKSEVSVIVDLTYVESKDCAIFIPMRDRQVIEYDSFMKMKYKVKRESSNLVNRVNYVLLSATSINDEKVLESKKIEMFQYQDIPENGVIPFDKLDFLTDKTLLSHSDPQKSLFVVSRLGVGIAGLFLVAMCLKKMKNEKKLTHENKIDAIEHFISLGRRQRGPSFVSTFEQLEHLVGFADYLLS
jgi:hypothetical protein